MNWLDRVSERLLQVDEPKLTSLIDLRREWLKLGDSNDPSTELLRKALLDGVGDWVQSVFGEGDAKELGAAVGKTDFSGIGDRLFWLRNTRGMTQSQLSQQSGVNQGTISRAEAGKHKPCISVIKKLADALGVSVAELLGSDE